MSFHISLVDRRDLSGEIYRQLRGAILDGRLRPGDSLPPTRELARTLDVSRTTVTVAYDRLIAEELVVARVGAGTFVSEHAGRTGTAARKRTGDILHARAVWDSIELSTTFANPARFDFRTGLPDATLFPHRAWRRSIAHALHKPGTGVYGDAAGHRELRVAISRDIGISRGVVASPDDVTITNGTQQALDIIARVLLAPGDRIAVEDPSYTMLRKVCTALGIRSVGVPVDRNGLVVDALPRRTRAVCVTPSHQYPLGVSMTLARRRQLLEWAERNDAAVIEDDYDSAFRFGGRPLEPLQTIDVTGRVVYIGSFSKTMLPTLRLGFIVAPRSLRSAIHKAKHVTDWHTPALLQDALAHFIESGAYARHLRRAGRIYRERHARIARAITRNFHDELELIPSSTGLHLTALARNASPDYINVVVRRAMDAGVAVQTLSHCAVNSNSALSGLMFGYGAIATNDIDEGIRRLKKCF